MELVIWNNNISNNGNNNNSNGRVMSPNSTSNSNVNNLMETSLSKERGLNVKRVKFRYMAVI